MTTIRIVTYNLQGCSDPSAVCSIINKVSADYVALQNISDLRKPYDLMKLATETGKAFSSYNAQKSIALISNKPLKYVQTYDLGDGGGCMKADLIADKKRFSLINISLKGNFFKRPQQLNKLLGPDLFNTLSLTHPLLLIGDFRDVVWISGHNKFYGALKRLSPIIFGGTYPAKFPVFSCDRAYAMNGIKLINMSIVYSKEARRASKHLPIIVDIQINDNRVAIESRANSLKSQIEMSAG